MNDMNQCNFIGRLGKDPEVRYLPDGKACANLSIAVSESWKNKQTGQREERTEWVNISAFGKLAEIIGEYLKKGSQVRFEGKMRTRKWQDKNGQDRYTTEIIASELQMLGSRGDAGGRDNSAQPQGEYSQAPAQQQQGGYSQAAAQPQNHQN